MFATRDQLDRFLLVRFVVRPFCVVLFRPGFCSPVVLFRPSCCALVIVQSGFVSQGLFHPVRCLFAHFDSPGVVSPVFVVAHSYLFARFLKPVCFARFVLACTAGSLVDGAKNATGLSHKQNGPQVPPKGGPKH